MRIFMMVMSVSLVAASLSTTGPALGAVREPACSPGLAASMIATGDTFAGRPTTHATDADRAYGIAENEIAYCLSHPHPGTPTWKLQKLGLDAAEKRQRLEVAAQLPSARSGRGAYLATVLDRTHALASDRSAPAAVRSDALARYLDVCIAQTPVYRKGVARASCRTAALTPVPRAPRVVTSAPLKPTCSDPNVDARIVTQAPPVVSDFMTSAKLVGTSKIQVALGTDGHVTGTTVYKSGGNPALDTSAADAARRSTYLPAIVDCRAAASTVLFQVDFGN